MEEDEKSYFGNYEHCVMRYIISELPFIYKLAFKAERNNPKGCKKDREKMKKELLDWVNKVW